MTGWNYRAEEVPLIPQLSGLQNLQVCSGDPCAVMLYLHMVHAVPPCRSAVLVASEWMLCQCGILAT